MPRNAGDYVKSWGAALIRGAASNPEFTVDWMLESFHFPRGPSMYGINYQQSVYTLVVLICSRI